MDKTQTTLTIAGQTYRIQDPRHFQVFLDNATSTSTVSDKVIRDARRRYVREHPRLVEAVNEDGSPLS